MPLYPLTNFEIHKYYEKEPRFIGVFSRDNMLKKYRMGAYLTNLDEYADVDTQWIALFYTISETIYFNNFGVEHIPKEIK